MKQVIQTSTFNNTANLPHQPIPAQIKVLCQVPPPASSYLADDVPHLLGVDDVGRVDDGGEAGSVQLGGVLVLILWSGRGNRSRQRDTH